MSNYILCNPKVKIEDEEIFIVPNSITICFGDVTQAGLECYITEKSYRRLLKYRLKKELHIELVFEDCVLKGDGDFSHDNPIKLETQGRMKFNFDCPKGLELVSFSGEKDDE